MRDEAYTQEDIQLGKHMWYVIAEHTNTRVVNRGRVPIIFTTIDAASTIAQEAAAKTDIQHHVISVYDYNITFRRFMVLD